MRVSYLGHLTPALLPARILRHIIRKKGIAIFKKQISRPDFFSYMIFLKTACKIL